MNSKPSSIHVNSVQARSSQVVCQWPDVLHISMMMFSTFFILSFFSSSCFLYFISLELCSSSFPALRLFRRLHFRRLRPCCFGAAGAPCGPRGRRLPEAHRSDEVHRPNLRLLVLSLKRTTSFVAFPVAWVCKTIAAQHTYNVI